jgi:hypothetical protein
MQNTWRDRKKVGLCPSIWKRDRDTYSALYDNEERYVDNFQYRPTR